LVNGAGVHATAVKAHQAAGYEPPCAMRYAALSQAVDLVAVAPDDEEAFDPT
jgi:hypothetical protein